MRNPNGYGGVSRLPGNRRRPFRVRVTVGWEDAGAGRRVQRYATLGYFETRSEAMRALADYNRSPYDLDAKNVTFKAAFDQWSPGYFEKYPSTRRVTECAMGFCRDIWEIPLRELRSAQLQGVISAMDGKSRGYQSKVRSLMHMLFRWGISREVAQNDWSRYVELTAPEQESPRRIFTGPEVRRLWAYRGAPLPGEPESLGGCGLGDSVLVLLYTGLRVGELLNLTRQDIHLDARYIDLHGTKTRAARRTVPIHRRLMTVLDEMMLRRQSEYLVSDSLGRRLTYARYKGWFDAVISALGMEHTPHDTRHSFVSALDTAGVRRTAVKFIVGHSQKDVTDRYTHKNLPELIEAVDKVEY